MTYRYQQFTHQLSLCFFVMVMLTSVTMAAPTPDHASPTKVRRLLTTPKTTDQDRTLLEGIKEGSIKTIYYEISSGPPTHYLLLIFDPQPDRYQFHLYTGIEGMFHRVRSRGASRSSGKASWTLFDRHSAREVGWPSVLITYDPKESRVREQFIYDKLTLICNTNQSQTMLEKTLVLKRLPSERERSLNESLLLTETPQRVYSAHRLFRDEWGMYYLIEKRELLEVGERFRLLRGYRGEMRQISMITAAEDSEGLVMIDEICDSTRLPQEKRDENTSILTTSNGRTASSFLD